MKYEIVKLESLSGKKTSIYSFFIEEEGHTLFDRFLVENQNNYPDEIRDIVVSLQKMGSKVGAREKFFKDKEGKPGDKIYALFDNPDRKLRLYCMKFGSIALILGGGGPKNVATLQEDPKLKAENYLLRALSEAFLESLLDNEIEWTEDGMELIGNLELEIHEN